jgi:hypothetical protein
MGIERRRAERHSIGLKIEFDTGSGLSRDVSGLGVYFQTDVRFVEGDEIAFLMVIPDAVNVKCRGHVVRVDEKNGQYGVATTIDSYTLAEPSHEEAAQTAHLIISELRAWDEERKGDRSAAAD